MRRTLTAILAIALLLAGCGGEAGEETTVPPTTAPAVTSPPTTAVATTAPVTTSTTAAPPETGVEVVRDVPYHDGFEGASWPPPDSTARWNAPLLDVFSPVGGEGLPVVVIVQPGTGEDYEGFAQAFAAGGAVVFMPDWGGDGILPPRGLAQTGSSAEAVEVVRQVKDEFACAVSYSVAHAAEYGGDPTRLVLFGHSGGANQAGTAALTETSPSPGCAVGPTPWAATGLVFWEGDWLLLDYGWDMFETDLADLLPVLTPWPSLATAPDVAQTVFLVTDRGRRQLHRPLSETAQALSWRDPSGEMVRELSAVGAFADGYVDVGEESEVMVLAMNDLGKAAHLVALTDPGSSHEFLAPADFDLVVDVVLSLARG